MSQLQKCGNPFLFHGKRSISTFNCVYGSGNANVVHRQARFLKKLMTGSNRSRKKFFTVDQPVSQSLKEFGAISGRPVKSNKSIRRVEVLSTLFMEQITSLMSTGEVSQDLLGLGIAVSEVKISRDFSRVNVYWVASGTEKDQLIEPILRKSAGILRHELSQLRVMGMVPPIEFVKDKTISKIMEVETLLKQCDFGEDFVPTASKDFFSQSPASSKKTKSLLDDFSLMENKKAAEFNKNPKLNSGIKASDISTETELYNYNTMRQDMLGVRHDFIMKGIKDMMTRINNKKTLANSTSIVDSLDQTKNETEKARVENWPSSLETIEDTRENVAEDKKRKLEFFKYLRKQQLARSEALKQVSTSAKEKEFYDEEAFDRWRTKVFGNEFELDEFDNEHEQDYETHEDNYLENEYRK